MLEEDIALSNLALDLIGQARMLYPYAGEIEGKGRDEDKLAYFRSMPSSATACSSSSRTAISRRRWRGISTSARSCIRTSWR